ncbi:MAG TPA: citramalate synthase [Treponema sp.]|nr:MAG: citramalate synthase [Treponema sp. GWC1_61_84]OHE76877.1 MAG: citramalate synthase [Treponema sp. RIFOXYC1_FULL_61_9]HCM26134.1 citramalate synthase [Treponema sp.]
MHDAVDGLTAPAGTRIEIFDTTLRDGAQGEGITFSVQDKVAVARALDELGVAWIEAGNPGSNPKDLEFFRMAGDLGLTTSRLCAFGATRKKGVLPDDDPNVRSLLDANTEAVVLFGKSWDLHVTEVIRASLDENLAMIRDTVSFFKEKGKILIYDAEHFFDGWKANPDYALSTLSAAMEAGADRIVLCDTNGGCFPDTVQAGVRAAIGLSASAAKKGQGPAMIGIHAHDDAGMASANSVLAVTAGARHVQGTLVGFGERCGNAALAAIIPSLELKLDLRCLPEGRLELLSGLARRVAEIANVGVPDGMPYVGTHAFAHKAGMHADGILKVRRSFEHVDPAKVGNDRRFLMSEVGGRSAIAERAKRVDPTINKDHPAAAALAARLKALESEGWQFEGADASFELLVRRELGRYKPLFQLERYRVVSEHPGMDPKACAHAWVKVFVEGSPEIAAAEGDGPVNALDGALRRALERFYPELGTVRLSDFKVRVIDGKDATAAKVRVLIESTDGKDSWTTVGVSADIIDASRAALVDSIEYKLIRDIERRFKAYL